MLVVLATAVTSLVQCSPPAPPPPATSSPSSASKPAPPPSASPAASCAGRPSGRRGRARRELAAGLPRRTGATAPGRGRLLRIRRADASRRADRAPGRGRRRRSRSSSSCTGCGIRSRKCARSTTIRAPRTSCRWRTTTPRRSTADHCPVRPGLVACTAYGRAIDVNPLAQPVHRQQRQHRANDRRAIPRPQPHRPGDAARR